MAVMSAGSTILCFHHEDICPNTVLVPARCLRVQRDVQHSWLHQELEDFAQVLRHPCSHTCCRVAKLQQCNLCIGLEFSEQCVVSQPDFKSTLPKRRNTTTSLTDVMYGEAVTNGRVAAIAIHW